jgi:hypothetical protein
MCTHNPWSNKMNALNVLFFWEHLECCLSPVQSRYDPCDSLSWVLGRVVAFQPAHASNSPLLSQSIQLFVENLQSHHLNSCFRWWNFQRSFGTMRDMLIPMPCIGRVFHIFCGSHFSYFATPSHRNMMELSIVKWVFLGAEWRWLSLNILFILCGSPSRLMWLVFASLTL